MSYRERVIRHVTDRMITAFVNGQTVDAQNMNAFITCLGNMSDEEFDHLSAEAPQGAIS